MIGGWRTALRIARREARRAKGRAALVVATIAVAVGAMSFGAVVYDLYELRPQEKAERLMGTAQAVVSWPFDGAVEQEPDFLTAFPTGTANRAGDPTMDRMLAQLPAGTTAIPDQRGSLNVHTATGTATLSVRALDYADPLATGILRQVSGRAPAAADEVALTENASDRLGTGIGGSVRLVDGGRTLRVVGIVEEPDSLAATTIVLRPGALPADLLPVDRADQRWLVATSGPLTWPEVKQLNTSGLIAVSRQVLMNPPDPSERYVRRMTTGGPPAGTLLLIGGMAMLEIVLLAGAALAVGARRRRRDLALVAAAGGSPAQVRRIVLADGVVLGAVAALIGLALGIATAATVRPLMDSAIGYRSGGFRIFPEALALLAGVAVVAGVLAALVPAWIAARQDVVMALAGRRGITRSRRRWVIVGIGLIAAGIALGGIGATQDSLEIILFGLILGELGLVLCTPALVGLVARLGGGLPLAMRVALRDASRNRTAAAPAISAVMAAVIASVGISIVFSSIVARDAEESAGALGDVTVTEVAMGTGDARPLPPDVLAQMRAILPVGAIHEISLPTCPTGAGSCFGHPEPPAGQQCPYLGFVLKRPPNPDEQRAARADARCTGYGAGRTYFGLIGTPLGLVVIIDEAAATAVTEIPAGDADRVRAALRDGSVVVSDPRYLDGGRVTLAIEQVASSERWMVTAPAVALSSPPKAGIAMLTEQTAQTLGLGPGHLVTTLVKTTRMPTVAEQDRLQAALGSNYQVTVERGAETDTQTLLILAIVAAVIALGAAASATGLAAADGRADLATLAAVGAAPRLRRALSLSQTGVIAGLGSLLGVAAGLGASTAVLFAVNQGVADDWPAPTPLPISVPWLNVGIALVAVPLVAMLGAGLLTRSRLPIERRL